MMDKCKQLFEIIADFYRKEGRSLPWRESTEPYRVWLSEIMLQQTRVEAVIPYFHRFLDALPTVRDLAEAEEETVLKLWEGLGYYSRARNLHRAAKEIARKHGGAFPESYEGLLSLPGVGEYTAAAVGSICFGLPRAAVDGNVLRIYTRLFEDGRDILNASVKREITESLSSVFPEGAHAGETTQGFMEIGQRFCLPNGAPLCEECPLSSICDAAKHGTQSEYPHRAPKAKRKTEEMTVLLLHIADGGRGRFVLRKRPKGGLLGGLWEFPNTEGTLSAHEALAFAQNLGAVADGAVEIPGGVHIFTHKEWHMSGYLIECTAFDKKDGFALATADEIKAVYPIASAFGVFKKQILEQ